MSDKAKFPLAIMERAATDLCGELFHHVARLYVCGSVRRGKEQCSDIELVFEPLPDVPVTFDIFGEPTEWQNPSLAKTNLMINAGVLSYRYKSDGTKTWGKENRLAIYHWHGYEIPVDLFAVFDPTKWGTHIAIRTGSADFNKRLLTKRSQGGWMPDIMGMKDSFTLYRGISPVPCPTEEDFFREIGIRWIAPEDRHEAAVKPFSEVRL